VVIRLGEPADDARSRGNASGGSKSKFAERCVDIIEQLRDPDGVRNVVTESPDFFFRYSQGIRAAHRVLRDPGAIRPKPIVYWLYGATGVGKSRSVAEKWPGALCYWKPCDHKWWDKYEWNECVCLDDLRGTSFRFEWLLTLFEQNPLIIEMKGDSVYFNSKYIVVTSPTPPLGTFAHDENMDQLMRRIFKVICVEPNKEIEW